MKIQIERNIRKDIGSAKKTYFAAEINGKSSTGYYIFRDLLGITSESNNGLFEAGEITIHIGSDSKTFVWEEDLYTIEGALLQETLQKRIDEVQKWKATLSYERSDTITVEI